MDKVTTWSIYVCRIPPIECLNNWYLSCEMIPGNAEFGGGSRTCISQGLRKSMTGKGMHRTPLRGEIAANYEAKLGLGITHVENDA